MPLNVCERNWPGIKSIEGALNVYSLSSTEIEVAMEKATHFTVLCFISGCQQVLL